MSFQSVYSSKKFDLPEVILLSAGEDQTIICGASTVFLTATVDDPGNLPGHTLEWEQLNGATVITTTPLALSTNYPLIENSDKEFRFYIDKGRPQEQFMDVRIFHTPTDFPSFNTNDNDHILKFRLPLIPVDCPSIISTVVVSAPLPSTLVGLEPDPVNIDITLDFSHPDFSIVDPGTTSNYLSHISQYSILENGIEITTIPPSPIDSSAGAGPPLDSLSLSGLGLNTYTIDTLYNIQGFTYTEISCEADFSLLVIPSTLILNDTAPPVSTNPLERDVDIFRYTFISNSEPIENPVLEYDPASRYANISRFTFITNTEPEDTPVLEYDSMSRNINITRFFTQDVGSG